jgi:rod shape-determining protein MreD
MRTLLVLIPIMFLAFFEATITSLHLCLLGIILWASLRPSRQALLVAFLAGVILDLLKGQSLGVSSLLFLVISFLIGLYKNRFQAARLAFLLPFTLFSILLADLIFHLPILARSVFINTLLMTILLPIFNFFSSLIKENGQLRLSFENKI